jgi:hypothetical protein
MKKFYVLTLCIAMVAMTGCGGSGKKDKPAEVPADITADVTYTVNDAVDVATLFDIAVEYADADGVKSETIAALPWSKSVHVAKIPFNATLKVTYTAKNSYDAKEKYEVGFASGISYSTSDGQGINFFGESKMTIGADKIADFVAKYTGTSKEWSENIVPSTEE